MRKTVLLFLLLLFVHASYGYTERNLLQKAVSESQLKELLLLEQAWVKYPAYEDRAGWERLLGEYQPAFIAKGESLLSYDWKIIKATDYLEYIRSGNRSMMQGPNSSNVSTLTHLLMAELAEGNGRFLDQIINGCFLMCERTSWVLSAHLHSLQRPKTPLPDSTQRIIDLGSASLGSQLSWIYYFLHEAFDGIDPLISTRLKEEIEKHICENYLLTDDLWWMGFRGTQRSRVNNWNPWCNTDVLQCFLLLENDKDKLAKAVYRTLLSVDHFINNNKNDGCCDEGPSYWGHAAGKLYDYLQLLFDATGGRLNYFGEPLLTKMGEYISRSYVGKGWVSNFADAEAKIGLTNAGLIYRYGKAVSSLNMMQFAAFLNHYSPAATPLQGADVYRSLENIACQPALSLLSPEVKSPASTWYNETEVCYMASDGVFVAVKAGFNNENHNHNDVGSFIYYCNQIPFFIDAGTATYTRQTFGLERYQLWMMQSDYHNLPLINGVSQRNGDCYRAQNVAFDSRKMMFSADISAAYPPEAKIESWCRLLRLNKSAVEIEERFQLSEAVVNNRLHFLTWGKVDASRLGLICVTVDGISVALKYDSSAFSPTVEDIVLDDVRLSKIWGSKIYRIILTAKKREAQGRYKISIAPMKTPIV